MMVTGLIKGSTKGIKVYMDGEYRYLLYPNEIRRYHLTENEEVEEHIVETIDRVVYRRALDKAVTYLENGELSEANLRFKLRQKGFHEDIVNKVVIFVQQYHYQDDYRYARAYVMSRGQSKSLYEIRQYLRLKGVDDALISRAIEENEVDEQQVLYQQMSKKVCRLYEITDKDKNRIISYFVRKGYSYSMVQHCYNDLVTDKKS